MKEKNLQHHNLTTDEWVIYNFLKENTEKDLWTKQCDILMHLETKGFKIKSLRQVRKLVRNIKDNDLIQKIIISSKDGYKILSEEQQYSYLQNNKIKILKMLKLYYKDVKRLNMNNQMRITFGEYERNFIESIMEIDSKKIKNSNS